VKTPVEQLIPLSFFASLGAPIAYIGYACLSNLMAGKDLVFSTVSLMFISALMFSWFVCIGLAILTLGSAKILGFKNVNVFVLTVCYLALIFLVVTASYGVDHLWVFALVGIPNAVILVLLSKHWGKSGVE
jgi:hypothetical protein